MDYESFIGTVQNRAQLDSREDALRVSRITLATLSRRIEHGAAENLAAQLPDEIGRHLTKVDELEPFDWGEFVDRLVEDGGYDPRDERADAVHHARVVLDVVDEATEGSALDDVRDELPADGDWAELFELVKQETPPVGEEQRPE